MIESTDKDIVVTIETKLSDKLYTSSYNSLPLLFNVADIVIFRDLYLLDPIDVGNSLFIVTVKPADLVEGSKISLLTSDIGWVTGKSISEYLKAVSKIKEQYNNGINL